MKHKIEQTKKDLLGQYMTTNADKLLRSFAHLVKGRDVVDPCAGHGDLLRWAEKNGAASTQGYDIDPQDDATIENDLFKDVVDCKSKLVVTNPPYLHSNRAPSEVKWIYDKWGQDDLYKCYLATMEASNVEEAIIIQPSNFLFQGPSAAREMFFSTYHVESVEHWREEVFDDAVIGIMVMHVTALESSMGVVVKQYAPDAVRFNITNMTADRTMMFRGYRKNGYLMGQELFEYIENDPNMVTYKFGKLDHGMEPNCNICFSILTSGKYPFGAFYNEDEPIYNNPRSYTTFQVHLPDCLLPMPEEFQRTLVDEFNRILNKYYDMYDGMWVGNYINAKDKILSRTYINKILSKALKNKTECYTYSQMTTSCLTSKTNSYTKDVPTLTGTLFQNLK